MLRSRGYCSAPDGHPPDTSSDMATAPTDSGWPFPAQISARFSSVSHLLMTTTRLKQVSPVSAAFYTAHPVSVLQAPAPA